MDQGSSQRALRRVTVFSGSRPGARASFSAAARAFGAALAKRGLGLVYGGASVGLMGDVADAALAGGAEVIGILPSSLRARELGHAGLSELRIVDTMHERKLAMSERGDAFVALPGGFGTFDELFEIVTWAQLGMHEKPVGLFDVDGFFAPLLALVDHAIAEGFVLPEHRRLFVVERDPERLLDALAAYRPPPLGAKWIARDDV